MVIKNVYRNANGPRHPRPGSKKWCSVVAVIKIEYREDGKENDEMCAEEVGAASRDERSHQHRPVLVSLAHGLADMRL